MTSLVHMLDSIVKQRAAFEKDEEARSTAAFMAGYEQYLAKLSADAMQLIESNYSLQAPDKKFASKGLCLPLDKTSMYFDYIMKHQAGLQDKSYSGSESFTKFKSGWEKAGIGIAVRHGDGAPYLQFFVSKR